MGARWKLIVMSVLFLLQGMHASAMGGTTSASAEGQKLGESKEQVVTEPTQSQLPGNRLVTGRILSIRSNQMEIDIGNVKSLYVPLRPAQVKGQTFGERAFRHLRGRLKPLMLPWCGANPWTAPPVRSNLPVGGFLR